ncbi:hypothetical protein M433DRAFT_73487 [Acidomyces richmondensis BFW]|nr:MAG: hypothetical protein FE78DRAFT_150999 [Acidomyces sp. 'richmondensis']KYG42573.1 hypothetical protein M433DRAFT_73487 [Acidomyces richmondensis BFW]
MLPDSIRLTWNEALSGVTGSISLACWIFLLVPQLIENYQQGSADGISLTFLFIWFVGDVTNLAGALWAGLVPTVIALAVYFCFADAVLIGQCLYYNSLNKKNEIDAEREAAEANGQPNERSRLISREGDGEDCYAPQRKGYVKRSSFGDVTDENLGLPGSRRRSSVATNRPHHPRRASTNELERILEEGSKRSTYIKNTVSVFLIFLVGAGGWAIAWRTGAWRPTPVGQDEGGKETAMGAEMLGYVSAVAYLGARIPQIIKNQRERSCDGLSLLFFLLSLLGNATYGAGILFHSIEKDYILTNLPWLIGSLGTMAEDAIIFVQFSVFGERECVQQSDSTAIE